jgi:hypothetical protein
MVIVFLIFPSALSAQEPWSRSSDNDYDPQLDRFYKPATLHRHNQPPDPIITFTGREDRLLDSLPSDNAEPSDLNFLTQIATGAKPWTGQHAQFTDWNNMNSGSASDDASSQSRGTQRARPTGQIILDELGTPIQSESKYPSTQYPSTQYSGSQDSGSRYPSSQDSEYPVPDGAVLLNAGFQQYSEQQFPEYFRGMSTEYNGYGDYRAPQDDSAVTAVSQSASGKFQPIRQVEPPHFSSQKGLGMSKQSSPRRPDIESTFVGDVNQDQTEKREPSRPKPTFSRQANVKPKRPQFGEAENSAGLQQPENSDSVSWSDNVETNSGLDRDQADPPSRSELNPPRRRVVTPSRNQFAESTNPIGSRRSGNSQSVSSQDNTAPSLASRLSQNSQIDVGVSSRPRKINRQVASEQVSVNQRPRQSPPSRPNGSGFGQQSQQQQASSQY